MSEWISVKDRLPDVKCDVLMQFNNNMAVGFLLETDEHLTYWGAYTDDCFYTACDYSPTHWMPLPEPPKGE